MNRPIILLSLLFLVTSVRAAALRGKVTDYSDGSTLTGVSIRIPTLDRETTTNSRGYYLLENLRTGTYVIETGAIGFTDFRFEIRIRNETDVITHDIELRIIEGLDSVEEQPKYLMEEVTITATRATSEHPVTFTNLDREQVTDASYGQDLPLLLSDMPNVSTYSEGGSGFGYSYLRVRGFAQDRIAVQINGIPLNDAETHEVFWVDLPDLAEDLADVQLQRGIGSSLYGAAAFGGTVNLLTRTPGLGDRALIRAEGMYGTWNTRRAMLQFQSGKVQDRYAFTGRLTRMESDGYRFGAWAKQWSYYLSAARFFDRHTTRINLYGGPERVHLAYEGVSKDYLEGRVSGDRDYDRKFNIFQFPGEIDNFFQPHYELHDEWELSSSIQIANSVYLFRGDGYYDQWREEQHPEEYYFCEMCPDVSLDVLRRRNISEIDGGWIPRATIEHRYGETTIGVETRIHKARHEGILVWSSYVPLQTSAAHRYYDYEIHKQAYSVYIHNLINIAPRLRFMFDLQARTQRLEMQNDRIWNVMWTKNYSSINPRTGLNYQFLSGRANTNSPNAVMYTSLSYATREPRPRDIYDPQDFYALPYHDYNTTRFQVDGQTLEYIGPSLESERMLNFEFGTHCQWRAASLGVSLYRMELRDAIVPYGALDNLGVPLSINAKKTVHQGIELVAKRSLVSILTLSGNLALTDHHFVEHREYDWIAGEEVTRNGNNIGFDPVHIANARVELRYHGSWVALSSKFVGKQYVDNSQDEDTAVRDYSLLNADVGYRFKVSSTGTEAIEPRLRVNNLLDTEYEAFGYNYGESLYIVGAPRSIFATVAVEW